jgi:cytochrome c-type biogenesis protein CcmH/NrfG
MIEFFMNEKAFVKSRLQVIGLYLLAFSLLFILSLLVVQNLLADIYYQKYIKEKNAADNKKQFEYIINAISLNKSSPEYLYECGKTIYEIKTITNFSEAIASRSKTNGEETPLAFANLKVLDRWIAKNNNPDLIPLSLCRESLRYNPLNAEAYLTVGLMYAELNPSDNNDGFFKMACKMDPNNISTHYSIGTYYLWNWNLKKALEEFRQIFIIPNLSSTFLAQYYSSILPQVYTFNSEYSFLAKISPSSYKASLFLATFLKDKNRWLDSKKAYYKAIKLAPMEEKSVILYKFALACSKNNDVENILRLNNEYERYITPNTKINKLFHITTTKALYSNKKYEATINKTDYLIKMFPLDHTPYLYKGLSLINLGKKLDGIYNLEKAAELKPDSINIRLTLATNYESIEQLSSAINEWQHIMQLAKNNAQYSSYYSEALNNIIRLRGKQKRASSLH